MQLTKDPDNEYDVHAVHITDLEGCSLGYVPREMKHKFCYPVTFGVICSMGRFRNDPVRPLGARVGDVIKSACCICCIHMSLATPSLLGASAADPALPGHYHPPCQSM